MRRVDNYQLIIYNITIEISRNVHILQFLKWVYKEYSTVFIKNEFVITQQLGHQYPPLYSLTIIYIIYTDYKKLMISLSLFTWHNSIIKKISVSIYVTVINL